MEQQCSECADGEFITMDDAQPEHIPIDDLPEVVESPHNLSNLPPDIIRKLRRLVAQSYLAPVDNLRLVRRYFILFFKVMNRVSVITHPIFP